MARKVATLQDNIRVANIKDVEHYAYWMGGTDTTNAALRQYDMLRTGYGRIFILQMPKFVKYLLPEESKKFKHLIEMANVGIDGIQGFTVDFTSITVGYVGSTIELPVNTKDDTSSITIKIYETQGSMIRTYLDFWITGTMDPFTGLSHYHGARSITMSGDDEGIERDDLYFSQANHTMEMLYVSTDPTGELPEYSCLLTNMFPKGSDHSHFNSDPGSHEVTQLSIEMTANKMLGAQINYIGKVALNKYTILKNYMNVYSNYSKSDVNKRVGAPNIYSWKGEWNKSYASKDYDYSSM